MWIVTRGDFDGFLELFMLVRAGGEGLMVSQVSLDSESARYWLTVCHESLDSESSR